MFRLCPEPPFEVSKESVYAPAARGVGAVLHSTKSQTDDAGKEVFPSPRETARPTSTEYPPGRPPRQKTTRHSPSSGTETAVDSRTPCLTIAKLLPCGLNSPFPSQGLGVFLIPLSFSPPRSVVYVHPPVGPSSKLAFSGAQAQTTLVATADSNASGCPSSRVESAGTSNVTPLAATVMSAASPAVTTRKNGFSASARALTVPPSSFSRTAPCKPNCLTASESGSVSDSVTRPTEPAPSRPRRTVL